MANWRQGVAQGKITDIDKKKIVEDVIEYVKERDLYSLRRVVNGTGIVVHTNLGRSLLPKQLEEHLTEIAFHYNTLEYDVEKGDRGSRYAHVEQLLKELLNVEAALVVNNNAAAVLLALNTLAKGKEVIVSRGELIEIGGSFRIPDVMAESGAILREVGTTNRTHLEDYVNAISENTGLLFKAHKSNYRIIGFTEEVSPEELVRIGKENGIPVLVDLGSGVLVNLRHFGLAYEPTVQDIVNAGVDVVTFSGDKLLGASQAGIIVGKKQYIDIMKRNPLTRALRVDKFCLSMLEGVLKIYLQQEPTQIIPTLQMLATPIDELERRAQAVREVLSKIEGVDAIVVKTASESGGGSLPGEELPSFGVALVVTPLSDVELEEKLRKRDIPIIGRIIDGRVVLDVRTLQDDDAEIIARAMMEITEAL
jgi:L-seryl-tRNA(Ser) seleniumtransferase